MLRQNPRDPARHVEKERKVLQDAAPKGPLLIERLPPAPLLKKSLCKTKSASIVTAAGGLEMDPSPREECESGP